MVQIRSILDNVMNFIEVNPEAEIFDINRNII